MDDVRVCRGALFHLGICRCGTQLEPRVRSQSSRESGDKWERQQRKPIRYPEMRTSNLVNVFLPVRNHNFLKPIGKEMMLKDGIKAQNRIFKVPHVVRSKYTCKMVAKRKDGSPGKATVTLYTDAIVVSIKTSTGSNVMESNVNDLTYTVTGQGTGFSWERKPEEKFEFKSEFEYVEENAVPSIKMQDTCGWIYNVAFWTSPYNNPNGEFKDPATMRPNS